MHLGSLGKRSGTLAAEYLRHGSGFMPPPQSPYSPSKSYVDIQRFPMSNGLGYDEDEFNGERGGEGLSFELLDDEEMKERNGGVEYEGLENVRACCDGKHQVGHRHHHHHSNQDGDSPRMIPGDLPIDEKELEKMSRMERPVSPSGWSFRSKTVSTISHRGSGEEDYTRGGMFSWGRSSRRSMKSVGG
jgi:hypothetical protein